jgi:hypothetical protein
VSTLERIAQYEHGTYTDAHYKTQRAATVSYDQKWLRAGDVQRGDESMDYVHRDGDSGLPTRVYLVSDIYPTAIFSSDSLYSGWHKRIDASMTRETPKPYDITLIDSSTLHHSPSVLEDTIRTFFRVSYYLDD